MGRAAIILAVILLSMMFYAERASGASTVSVSIPSGTAAGGQGPGYSPASLTLVIGVNNTVVWTNNDNTAHTVTPSDTPATGSWTIGSGNLDPGQSYPFTFTVPGSYTYLCAYHAFMSGSITVKSNSATTPEFNQSVLGVTLLATLAFAAFALGRLPIRKP